MKQLLAVAKNTYLQTVRQPLYGIIVLATLGGLALAPSIVGWTLEDDNKMLRDIGLSTLLIQGLFLGCFAASSVLNTEIDDKTVLTAVAKPIGRSVFLSGKFLGVCLAITTAHYLAGIAFFMVMRHGVLQSAAETFDVPVLIFGPGVALLLVIVATILNYVYDCRFLPTLLALFLPVLTISTILLLAISKDWKWQSYEITQTMDNLPPEAVDGAKFNGIIEFRPLEGQRQLTGEHGLLVRKLWQGPISPKDQEYLRDLSPSIQWKKDVNFLAQSARKLQGLEDFKAGILILLALGLLAAIAVASSTRVGMLSTFLICLIVLTAGLSADQMLGPLAKGPSPATWATVLYGVVPNFQCFWMVDALSDDRVIPWGYVGQAAGYAAIYIGAALCLGMALFETREVG